MHALACRSLHSAKLSTCRIVAGRRTVPSRSFRASFTRKQESPTNLSGHSEPSIAAPAERNETKEPEGQNDGRDGKTEYPDQDVGAGSSAATSNDRFIQNHQAFVNQIKRDNHRDKSTEPERPNDEREGKIESSGRDVGDNMSSTATNDTDPLQKRTESTVERVTRIWQRRSRNNQPNGSVAQDIKVSPEVHGWLAENNLKFHFYLQQFAEQVEVIEQASHKIPREPQMVPENEDSVDHQQAKAQSTERPSSAKYQIEASIMREIETIASASLHSMTKDGPFLENSKRNILLQSPREGGALFLDAVVTKIAYQLGADLLVLGPQDIIEIERAYLKADMLNKQVNMLHTLSYETYRQFDEPEKTEDDELDLDDDDADYAEDSTIDRRMKPIIFPFPKTVDNLKVIHVSLNRLKSMVSSGGQLATSSFGLPSPSDERALRGLLEPSSGVTPLFSILEVFLKTLQKHKVSSPSTVDNQQTLETANAEAPQRAERFQRPLIIQIQDCLEMTEVKGGQYVFDSLQRLGDSFSDEDILFIGTTSSGTAIPALSKAGFQSLQSEPATAPYRAIITPCASQDAEAIFASDAKTRIASINVKNLKAEILHLSKNIHRRDIASVFSEVRFDLTDPTSRTSDSQILPYDRVERIAIAVLGSIKPGESFKADHVTSALEVLKASDQSKFGWLQEQPFHEPESDAPQTKQPSNRWKDLDQKCNSYEKKLLTGVVDPSNLHTKYSDVHIPASSIEAVKTLTTLSLTRPEEFTYGVLSTDKIAGLLLYGPPGTGKTLLAKAVAKESQATVLEISGSDIYNMYVGEGEKNVRAIFTLAKKLSPCVVFIDEADAIFGSRNSDGNRTTHRELINQFLKEWDGLVDSSAFIMVATNRPFDLDDAVLRRLPRRLLIDLPTKSDREAILRIHLKDEHLDPSTDLKEIAEKTPFYSGSDLKNICVSAALSCVRESHEQASQHTGDTPYEYPKRRTLKPGHFENALQEISASISEDMSSLNAIRKFDDKYGDRKGRRKGRSTWGFGGLTEKEREGLDEGRVRRVEVAAPA